jgi:predicted transcriptional regulator
MGDLERSVVLERAKVPGYPRPLDAEVRRRQLIAALVAIRRENHLMQTDIAREMGVSQSVVADIESARFDVRYTTLDRYAMAVSQGSARLAITHQAMPKLTATIAPTKRSA